MNQKEKACSALTAVFPYPKSITDFVKDSQNRNQLQSFMDFAAGCGLIDSPTLDAFKTFVNDNSRPRQNDEPILKMMDLRLGAPDLIAFVKQAEDILMRGITVSSPTMDRILFLFLTVQMLKFILYENIKDDGSLSLHLTCPNDKIKNHMFYIIIGLYQQALPLDSADLNGAFQLTNEVMNLYKDLIALNAFIPSNNFYPSVFYWDILPVRNVGVVKETLKGLKETIAVAKTQAFAD